jgi:O-antigen/teichoic acid export membrane protein
MSENMQKYAYIGATLFSSAVGIIKSYFFMDLLSKRDLGNIAIFQSIIMIVSFLQMGSITGGYRLVSFSKNRYRSANDAVLSYLTLLLLLTITGISIFSLIYGLNSFLIIGTFVGIAALLTNWWSNLQVGLGRNKRLSILTFVSVLVSLTCIPLLYISPLYGAISLLALQPISFIILTYIFNKDFKFKISLKSIPYLKLIAKYGLIPFFVGILFYMNQQVERWVIGYSLGIESLGEYYLVFLYTTVVMVIPSALGNINFPKYMKLIRNNQEEKKSFFELFSLYYLELTIYLILMFIGTYFILPFLVEKLLPEHIIGISYVKIIFWGLCLYILMDPITFVLNANLHYKEELIIYSFALATSLSSYVYLYINKLSSLTNFAYVNVVFIVAVSIGYFIYFQFKGKKTLYKND